MASNVTGHYVQSILDTDLYKLTMQQAVRRHFPDALVTYKFTNRSKDMKFTPESIQAITDAVNQLEGVTLQDAELEWLKKRCPYFQPDYLEWLQAYRFKPKEQITIRYLPDLEKPGYGDLEMEFKGLWTECILYETPVMSTVSEAYFLYVDKDWTLDGYEEQGYQKGKEFFKGGIALSEFGARRRRSYEAQKLVIEGLIRAHKELEGTVPGRLSGTSNVHFAHIYDLMPIGTIAHEWMMGIGAIHAYERSTLIALELWEQVYPTHPSNALHIALTDTFTSEAFFKDVALDVPLAKRWRGLRQDSGDPIQFIYKARDAYEAMGIDHTDKMIVFSDSLNLETCFRIKKVADEVGFIASFGVGTWLTNDFKKVSTGEKSKATNIVIKLNTINDEPCIKISDDIMKNTGDQASVKAVKLKFGIPLA